VGVGIWKKKFCKEFMQHMTTLLAIGHKKQQVLGIQNTKLNINTYLHVEFKNIIQQVWKTL
jgi:hypothetical protein